MQILSLIGQNDATVKRTLHVLIAAPKPCTLCGKPATYNGVFMPTHATLCGGKPGKSRWFVYGLCKRCKRDPQCTLKVEGKLMRDLVGRGN